MRGWIKVFLSGMKIWTKEIYIYKRERERERAYYNTFLLIGIKKHVNCSQIII